MRAICESCAAPQPVDWRPGDLCGHCGRAVREELRCYWCAKWTPKGKFCRKCGAVGIAHDHYGPARMLKHMGASVFEIPKLLGELDPELIDTYQSIYSTHLAVANRHIDYARKLTQSLYHKHWPSELEEFLIPQLPWPDPEFNHYSACPLSDESTIPLIADLALLAQYQRGDYRKLRLGTQLIFSPNTAIAAEAALQFSGWRALYTTYTEIKPYQLIPILEQSPFPQYAAPRLAALGAEPAPAYAQTGDPDTDFLVLLLDQIIPSLETALDSSDPKRRFVAATQLIRKKHPERLGPTLRAAAEEDQLQLLQDIIRLKLPVPTLHDDLFALFETSENRRVSRSAARAITLAAIPADCYRLLEMSNHDRDVIQSLLLAPLAPETLYEIGRRQVVAGRFTMDQWGWDRAAKPGRMPVSFVEDLYGQASPKVQAQLLRFAEIQIEAHEQPELSIERFLIRQCFATAPAETIGAAWASIHRIQMHRTVGLRVPFDLTVQNVEWCWTMPEFLRQLAALFAFPEAVQQTFVRDDLDRFLRSANEEFYAAARQYPDECRRIIEAAPLADTYTYALRFAANLG